MKKSIALILSIIFVLTVILPTAAITAVSVKSIMLSSSDIYLKVGQTYNIKVTLTPNNTTQKRVAYVTGNRKIAVVDNSGKITGVKAGNTTITVSSVSNNKINAKLNVMVVSPELVGNVYKTGPKIVQNQVTLKILVNKSPLKKNNIPDTDCVKKLETTTNVKFDWQEVPSVSFADKVNILVATGDLPDAIFPGIPSSTFLNNLTLFVDTSDLIKNWMPNIKKVYDQYPFVYKSSTAPDGKMYSIPTLCPSPWTEIDKQFFMNKTWLDKLGLKVPQTTDEFYNVLKAAKGVDLNKNRKKDEIMLSFLSINIGNLFGSFGVLEGTSRTTIENGKVFLSAGQPGYFEALKYFNRLYSEGLMDQEVFSQNQQQLVAKGTANQLLSYIETNTDNIVGVPLSPDYICTLPLKGPNGDQAWTLTQVISGFNSIGTVISKKSKYPEVIARVLDYLNSSFDIMAEWDMGPEGVCWKKTGDGNKWEALVNKTLPAGFNSWGEWRNTLGVANSAQVYVQTEDYNGKNRVLDARSAIKLGWVNSYRPFVPKYNYYPIIESQQAMQDKNALFIEIDAYLKNFTAKSIVSGITDTDWQNHLAKLKSLHTDDYVKLMQQTYDKTH